MYPVSKLPLPANAVPAALPAESPMHRPAHVEPVTIIEADRRGLGRELISVDRRSEMPTASPQVRDGQAIRQVALAPESTPRDRGPEELGSIWFLAQVYGQRSDASLAAAAMDGHRDAPQIGTTAYRRAAADSEIYREQPVVFRFAV